jgi:hypothetical protein
MEGGREGGREEINYQYEEMSNKFCIHYNKFKEILWTMLCYKFDKLNEIYKSLEKLQLINIYI